MKQQFKTLLFVGLIFGAFSSVCAGDSGTSFASKSIDFTKGTFMALIQPFGGFNGLDEESNTYLYADENSPAYKTGANVGVVALCISIALTVYKALSN